MSTVALALRSEEALIRRVCAGDEDALVALCRRYEPKLQRYCRSIVRHDEDALDATQNTFTKALVAMRGGRAAPAVVPWLFHIARNEAISIVRRRRGESELPETAHGMSEPVGDLLLREELSETLEDIRTLPERTRAALVLREVAGLSYEQMAETLGGTEGAARQAVHEARRALEEARRGREADCDAVRLTLLESDGRRRSTRLVRAHLRACGACRDWREEQSARRSRFAWLPGTELAAPVGMWLTGVFGGMASSGVVAGTAGLGAKLAAPLAALTVGLTLPQHRPVPAPAPRTQAAHTVRAHTAAASGAATAAAAPAPPPRVASGRPRSWTHHAAVGAAPFRRRGTAQGGAGRGRRRSGDSGQHQLRGVGGDGAGRDGARRGGASGFGGDGSQGAGGSGPDGGGSRSAGGSEFVGGARPRRQQPPPAPPSGSGAQQPPALPAAPQPAPSTGTDPVSDGTAGS